jgi:putative endonuclease
MERTGTVYIMASGTNGTLYVGATSDLVRRVWQHRNHAAPGFTDRYNVVRLVWYETGGSMAGAIAREKAIKKWQRAWKIRLIEATNPAWRDLAVDFGYEALSDAAPASGFPPARE